MNEGSQCRPIVPAPNTPLPWHALAARRANAVTIGLSSSGKCVPTPAVAWHAHPGTRPRQRFCEGCSLAGCALRCHAAAFAFRRRACSAFSDVWGARLPRPDARYSSR